MPLGGFLLGFLPPRYILVPTAGLYLGQLGYCFLAMPPVGFPIFPCLVSIGIFGVPPAILGSLLALGVVRMVRRSHQSQRV